MIAAGPWCRNAEPWLDIAIPVDPLKGQIIRMKPDGPGLDHELTGGGSSMYNKPDGLIWCGATEEEAGFDLSLTDDARESVTAKAMRLMPSLANAEVGCHRCLRPSHGRCPLWTDTGWEIRIHIRWARRKASFGPASFDRNSGHLRPGAHSAGWMRPGGGSTRIGWALPGPQH